MENVVKKGLLNAQARGVGPDQLLSKLRIQVIKKPIVWPQRYYVLCAAKPNARLDFYDNEECYKTNPTTRRTIFLEDVESVQAARGVDYCFQLNTKESIKMFKAENVAEMKSWIDSLKKVLTEEKENSTVWSSVTCDTADDVGVVFDENAIYESAESPVTFSVDVLDSEGAKRCGLGGACRLLVGASTLIVERPAGEPTSLSWPYRFIRRYGRSKNTFTFEAGRRCTSGQGVFNLKTEEGDGELIFEAVQLKTKMMKSSDGDAPALPARHYQPGEDGFLSTGEELVRASSNPNIPPSLQRSLPPIPTIQAPEEPEAAGRIERGKGIFKRNKSNPLPAPPVRPRPDERKQVTHFSTGGGTTTASYDLAKIVRSAEGQEAMPGSRSMEDIYSETYEGKAMNVDYRTAVPYSDHTYDVYDITRSSRFPPTVAAGGGGSYDDMDGNYSDSSYVMARLSAQLKKQSLSPTSVYDTMDLVQEKTSPGLRRKQGRADAAHTYSTVSGKYADESDVYDEIAPQK